MSRKKKNSIRREVPTDVSELSSNKGSALVSLAAVIVVIYGMQMAKVLLVPFLIAAFLALITVRPMLWLQKKRIPSFLAALIIVSAIMLLLAAVGTILGSSIADFTAALPGYQARLDNECRGNRQRVSWYGQHNDGRIYSRSTVAA